MPAIGEPFNPHGLFTGIFIPEAMVRYAGLSATAKLAYGRLVRYAGRNGQCYPAVATLAAEIGIGKRRAQECLSELEAGGFIRRDYRDGKATEYAFLWHPIFSGSSPMQDPAPMQESAPPPMQDPAPKESHIKNSLMCASAEVGTRFEEFWQKYPRKVGRDAAATVWISVVTAENEQRVLACLDRYLQSGDVARGAVPNAGPSQDKSGWLLSCSRDNWECDWPAAREQMAPARAGKQAAIDREWAEVANGKRQD